MTDLLPAAIKNFIDAIFSPPLSFLTLMRDMLNNAGNAVGKGINLNNYFSFFAYMPSEWQSVIQSALASIVLLAILFLVRSAWDMYFKVKGSSQWW